MPRTSARRSRSQSSGSGRQLLYDTLGLASTLLDGRRQYVADKVHAVAESTRSVGDTMSDLPNVQAYVEAAADGLDDFASYVTETDLRAMLSDTERFVRQRPMTTFAVAIAAGLAATQLARQLAPPLFEQAPVAARRAHGN